MADKNVNNVPKNPRKHPRKSAISCNPISTPEDDLQIITCSESIDIEKLQPIEKIDDQPSTSKSIMGDYKYAAKVRNNHFIFYEDVKVKPEKKPSIVEIANSENVSQEINGWKINELADELGTVASDEKEILDGLKKDFEDLKNLTDTDDEDVKMCGEILSHNIQRSGTIEKQLLEAQSMLIRLLDHKERVKSMLQMFTDKKLD